MSDVIGFPKLDRDAINPVAVDIASGPHALKQADSLLTYMNQILIKGRNLNREDTIAELDSFPLDWKVQYVDIAAPIDFQPTEECPRWVPGWWDQSRFGPWHNVRLVRCHIPPSYRSASSKSNYHWVVIGFGEEISNRLELLPPYDHIYFWYCFSCPSLNGTLSMDRHLATLLKGLSFLHLYRSTAKTSNLLNTVADPIRQSLHVLPPAQHSVNLPEVIPRRSKDRRARLGGLPNPLYDLRQPATVLPVRQLFTQTGVDNNNNAQRSAGQQQPPVQTSSNMSIVQSRAKRLSW